MYDMYTSMEVTANPFEKKRGTEQIRRFRERANTTYSQNITFLLKYICKPLRKTISSEEYGCRQVDRDIPARQIVIEPERRDDYCIGGGYVIAERKDTRGVYSRNFTTRIIAFF